MFVSLYAAVGFTVTSKHAHRDSCSTPSACCAAAADEQAAEPANRRPFAVGHALAGLVAVALSAGDRQAGNSNRVAAKRVSIVLALEEQSREVWSTLRQPGNTRGNPADEYGKSTMGSTTDSWRVAETGNTGLSGDGSQVHGASTKATLANVAHFS